MKNALKQIAKHLFAILLIFIPLIFIFIHQYWMLPRAMVTGISAFNKAKSSILFYMNKEFKADYLLNTTWTIPGTVHIIPDFDLAAFWENTKIWFRILFTKQNFLMWVLKTSDGLMAIARFLMIAICIGIFIYILFLGYFDESNNDFKVQSKPLKTWIKLRDGPLHFIKSNIANFCKWFINSPYIYCLIVILIFNFGLPFIAIDIVSEYFYFFTSFDFKSIGDVLISSLITLYQGIAMLPLWIKALIVYAIVRFLTVLRARRIVEGKLIPRNEAMVNSDTGVFTLILGKMRGGKTTLATSMGRILNTIYHKNAYDNMNRVSMMFPEFPWIALEKEILRLSRKRRIVNMDQCAKYVYTIYNVGSNKPFVLFGYDVKKKRSLYYDGSCNITLKDAMAIYAESYWIYFHKGNLIASNYPIRTDDIRLDKGHLILWDYNHFRRKNRTELWENSSLSRILVFDMLRMGRKIDKDNIYKDCSGPMIGVATEFGKEYGNMVTNSAYSVTDENANPKNDLMDYSLKLGGHLANIWHTNFFKFIADEQRSGSLSANLVDVAQSIFTADPKNQKEKTTLSLFWLEPVILDAFINLRDKFYSKYRYNREDQTLMFHLINKLGSWAYQIESYIYMRFGYKQISLPRCTSDSSGNLTEGESEKFYIINYIDYSERFESACMKDFLNSGKKEAYRGFFDLPEYKKLMPNKSEWDLQGSYLVCDLEDPFRKFGTRPASKSGRTLRVNECHERSPARKGGDIRNERRFKR